MKLMSQTAQLNNVKSQMGLENWYGGSTFLSLFFNLIKIIGSTDLMTQTSDPFQLDYFNPI